MDPALPSPDQWPDLAPGEVEILDPAAADAEGRWQADADLVLRIRGLWTISADLLSDGLRLSEATLRLQKDGMRWSRSHPVGILHLAPEDASWEEERIAGGGRTEIRRVLRRPLAPSPEDRRDVVLRAFSRAAGPEARRRTDAIRALARLRLLCAGARSGVVKPLEDTPRILVHKPDGTTSTQSLFRRADGGSRTPPDLRALLHGGACRQVGARWGTEILRPCDEIKVSLSGEPPSRHALLAAAEDVIGRFDALGADVRPWIARRAR